MFLIKNVILAGDSVSRESDDGCDEDEEEHDGAEHDQGDGGLGSGTEGAGHALTSNTPSQ